jgi:phosphoribosylformimino-5-aminoimidazole carboxamide ribotide isomerase
MQIIPAIDLIDGKCVRLSQGDYAQKKIYNKNPLEVARQFEDAGLVRLHLVDLDGAKAGRLVNLQVLEVIATHTSLTIDFGGGIKTDQDMECVFQSGAAIATVGSIAVKQPEIFFGWLERYGGEKILLGADVKGEKIAIHGWTEQTELSVFDFLEGNISKGLKQAFCTDISKDGLLQGPSITLYERMIARFPVLHFIASGGVSSMDDLIRLKEIGCQGAIIGKAFYEGRISIGELASFGESRN